MFAYKFNWQGPRAMIGCGAILILFGILLLTPLIAALIKVLGWTLVALGVVVIALGLLVWTTLPRNRGDRDDGDRS